MDQAVQDRVCDGGVADHLVPVLDRKLAPDRRGARGVAVFQDLEEVSPLDVGEQSEPEVIDQQELGLCQAGEKLAIGPVDTRAWRGRPAGGIGGSSGQRAGLYTTRVPTRRRGRTSPRPWGRWE